MPDFSHYSIAQLQALLRNPQIAEPMRAKLQAELDGRGTKAKKKRAPRDLPTNVAIRASILEGGPLGSIELLIRPEPPSANNIKRALYHPGGKHQYQRYLESLALALTAVQLRYNLEPYRTPVTVEHFWRVWRHRDDDSFGLSLKPVLDALEQAGILHNDRLARLSFTGQESVPHADRELRLRILPQ